MPKASDLFFEFGIRGIGECGYCGKKFDDHGITMTLMGGAIAGDDICGDCLGAGPKGLAKIARERAEVVKGMPPGPDDDPDLYTHSARCLRKLAKILDGLDDFRPIRGGVLAMKIAEAYRELGGRLRRGKAA